MTAQAAALKCFSSKYCALLIFLTLMHAHKHGIIDHIPQLTSCLFSYCTNSSSQLTILKISL